MGMIEGANAVIGLLLLMFVVWIGWSFVIWEIVVWSWFIWRMIIIGIVLSFIIGLVMD